MSSPVREAAGPGYEGVTPYHAALLAWEIRREGPPEELARIGRGLFDARVDLNPHQVEAALFALRSPLSNGVLLADEVGLGKTIEAGLVLTQLWSERRRRLLVVCPANLRKQWALELEEKFGLPVSILDARALRDTARSGSRSAFERDGVVIASVHFAARRADDISAVPWDLVVIDEAHRLRNVHKDRSGRSLAAAIRTALTGRRKILMTATPLQNSIDELYGLSTFIDDFQFGDAAEFVKRYRTTEPKLLEELGERLRPWCKRTLRRDVLEYVRYTDRRPMTRRFHGSDEEARLHEDVRVFLLEESRHAIPPRQRALLTMVLQKILASSTPALVGTLEKVRDRLQRVLADESAATDTDWVLDIVQDDDLGSDYEDEVDGRADVEDERPVRHELEAEIARLGELIEAASRISVDAKTHALLAALEVAFDGQAEVGAPRKALIFTESRRTQAYLRSFLEQNGYAGKLVTFSGTNSDPETRAQFEEWKKLNAPLGRVTGSRDVDIRMALVDRFRDPGTEIMIATEAAAEGMNLQFCSLVVNYDLPWNPQRIEQRIGRCHRYGQKHDVIVVNFLNTRNLADERVFELLSTKFALFEGVFGASDEVLGTVESGIDFEKRVAAIYATCRTEDEIEAAFGELRSELEDSIRDRMVATRELLLEHFDEGVHTRLRASLSDARVELDRVGHHLWRIARQVLAAAAVFDEEERSFTLLEAPGGIAAGTYTLNRASTAPGVHPLRTSDALGEYLLEAATEHPLPSAMLEFEASSRRPRIALLDELIGKDGWLVAQIVDIAAFASEQHIVLTAVTTSGESVASELPALLFECDAVVRQCEGAPPAALAEHAQLRVEAKVAEAQERNAVHFRDEVERLERWADDALRAAEMEHDDARARLRAAKREIRRAETLDDQLELQRAIRDLEGRVKRSRREIFQREEEIEGKRDGLIDDLATRLRATTSVRTVFGVRWCVR